MGLFFFFSSRRRHTRYWRDWSSDVCSSDLRGARPRARSARRRMSAMEAHAREYNFCSSCPKVCRFSCPVSESTKNETTTPWGKMTAAHLALTAQRPLDAEGAKALHACTGCGRCTEFCKHHNGVAGSLFAARGEAIARGVQPAGASSTLGTFAQAQNPFGRQLAPIVARWRAEAPVRYPLFPGCSSLVK